MTPRSLQNRLLLGILVCVTIMLIGGGIVMFRAIEKQVEGESDALLRDRLGFYEAIARTNERGKFSMFLQGEEWARIARTGNPDLVLAWYDESGTQVPNFCPALRGENIARPQGTGQSLQFVDVKLADGRPARFATRVVLTPAPAESGRPLERMHLMVGRDLVTLEKTLSRVRWLLLYTGAGLIGVLLLAVRLIIRRGVKPVNSLAHQIEHMPLADSSQRFGLPGAPSELEPVVGRLNALMDRVTAAIEHERQFASNAAHELRNPLAAIRSRIEVALSRTRKAEEYEETLDGIWQSQQGMQRVVDHLLLLARLESGHSQQEFVRESFALTKALKKAWRNCIDLAEERHLRVSWQVEDPGKDVITVASLFDILLKNMLENAVAYTPPEGVVRITAFVRDRSCEVCVMNTNPGLTADQIEQTFAPFWRADPNASGHRGNAGIGLALCRRIVATLEGQMYGALTNDGMVSYGVRIPVELAPAASPATTLLRE